jgi:hypothetical protein
VPFLPRGKFADVGCGFPLFDSPPLGLPLLVELEPPLIPWLPAVNSYYRMLKKTINMAKSLKNLRIFHKATSLQKKSDIPADRKATS